MTLFDAKAVLRPVAVPALGAALVLSLVATPMRLTA